MENTLGWRVRGLPPLFPSTNLTRGLAARRPRKDTIRLQTSMSSPGFEPRPYERFDRNVSIMYDYWEQWLKGMVLPQADRVPAATWHYREGRPPYSAYSCDDSYCVSSEPYCICGRNFQWMLPELIGGRNRDLLCFLLKTGSALVPVVVVCWSEGGQENASNHTVCGLDTLDLHLEPWSGEQEHSRVYPKHRDCKFVHQSGNLTYSIAIYEQHSWESLQKSNARPHTVVVTQRDLKSNDKLHLPVRL
ncbi:HTH_Tnp_Tc3_2 domain-containing protein [Trichonephila clavipes]|nr:HTH_Tnp_Tc3_2 domain-containing protein [Trichonephila clavipes]